MQDKRTYRIHWAASILVPLALLVSAVYTLMFRAVGLLGRYLSPVLAVAFFFVGYALMYLQEKIFAYPRTAFYVDDGVGGEEKRFVKKRFLILPALLAVIPASLAVPLVDNELKRLSIAENQYYQAEAAAPWFVFAIIVLSAIFGAAARMTPGNVSVTPFSVLFHAVCHAAIFIIDIFMEIPTIMPGVMMTLLCIISIFELNTACVENLARKTGDVEGLPKLRETNYLYVKRIVINFLRVFAVPFLFAVAFSVFWQYALVHFFNQPL